MLLISNFIIFYIHFDILTVKTIVNGDLKEVRMQLLLDFVVFKLSMEC